MTRFFPLLRIKNSYRRLRGRRGKVSSVEQLETRHEGFYKVTDPLTVWKQTREGLAKLEIPAGATVFTPGEAFGIGPNRNAKMRASEANVIQLYDKTVTVPCGASYLKASKDTVHHAIRRPRFEYQVGENVTPHKFSYKTRRCEGGIHFYTSKQAAKDH